MSLIVAVQQIRCMTKGMQLTPLVLAIFVYKFYIFLLINSSGELVLH